MKLKILIKSGVELLFLPHTYKKMTHHDRDKKSDGRQKAATALGIS